MANIKTSAAELIGKTPLLEVKKFEAKENITDTKILAKLEYFNPATWAGVRLDKELWGLMKL